MSQITAAFRYAKQENIEQTEAFLFWKKHFDYLHGGVDNLKKVNSKAIADYYGLRVDEQDKLLFLFCLESLFAGEIMCFIQALLDEKGQMSDTGRLQDLTEIAEIDGFELNVSVELYAWIKQPLTDHFAELIEERKRTMANWASPQWGDIVQARFQTLFDKKIRHATGAFFTPEWQALQAVVEAGEASELIQRKVLEPTCGSGVFSLALWKRFSAAGMSNQQMSHFFQHQFAAYELNPISVLAAKLNWLRIFLDCQGTLTANRRIPIYFRNCLNVDSIGKSQSDVHQLDLLGHQIEYVPQDYPACDSTGGRIVLPSSVVDGIAAVSESQMIRQYLTEYVIGSLKQDTFDVIFGNPPWINWETLSATFRKNIEGFWPTLGLFDGKNKSFSKEDLSTFITFYCIDKYLNPESGELIFVMPQSLLQSKINSRGFRNLTIASSLTALKMQKVLDYTNVSVFKGVSAKSCVLVIEKGAQNRYPVPYFRAQRAKVNRKDIWHNELVFEPLVAVPSDSADLTSSWLICQESELNAVNRTKGDTEYRARAGMFTGGANALYYLDLLAENQGVYQVENVTERAKIKFDKVRFKVEQELVYPFARGRDVSMWRYDHDPARAVLFPHTIDTAMKPIAETEVQQQYPNAYQYLSGNRNFLLNRGGLTTLDTNSLQVGFYTLLRIGKYTFAPYKVVWKYIAKEFTLCVLGPSALLGGEVKATIPQEKLMTIEASSAQEAYFLCGYLSSWQIKFAVESKMVSTQISASIINGIRVPKFDDQDARHLQIAQWCRAGHEAAAQDPQVSLDHYRELISQQVDLLLSAEG